MNPKRRELYKRQKGICHYCKTWVKFSKWTTDHIIPKSKGGGGEWRNVIGACNLCNEAKADMDQGEFQEFLNNLAKYNAPKANASPRGGNPIP